MPHTLTKTMLLSFLPSSASQFFVCLFFLPNFYLIYFSCSMALPFALFQNLSLFLSVFLGFTWFLFLGWTLLRGFASSNGTAAMIIVFFIIITSSSSRSSCWSVALHYMAVAFMGYTMLKNGNDLGNDAKWLQLSQHYRKGRDNKTTKSAKEAEIKKPKLWFLDHPLFFMWPCSHVNLHASAVRMRHKAICCHWGSRIASRDTCETSAMHCHRHGASAPCSQICRSNPSDGKAFDKRQSGCIAMLHRLDLICRLCCLFWWAWLENYIKSIL